VCRCGAYRFPHRMCGGRCDGGHVVLQTFADHMWDDPCRDCMLREEREDFTDGLVIECQVIEGREHVRECPAWQDVVQGNEIRLYGVNKPPERRCGLRFRR
jgi:hypothetical protein